MILKDNYDVEKMKEKQVKEIKDALEKVINEGKECYKENNVIIRY